MIDDRFSRFWTQYSAWGFRLDLDQLLRDGSPVAFNEVWRQGDYNPLGGGALTAGLNMDVYTGDVADALYDAVAKFLSREARLLQAVREQGTVIDHAGLCTFISVGSEEREPFGIELPPSLMKELATAEIPWAITASVFEGKPPTEGE